MVSVPVLFFIQPDSTQPCLLGMNALPALGLSFLNAKGKPLQMAGQSVRISARVSLIDCKSVPARASSFIEAKVESEKMHGTNPNSCYS